jgi:hypothetical protein
MIGHPILGRFPVPPVQLSNHRLYHNTCQVLIYLNGSTKPYIIIILVKNGLESVSYDWTGRGVQS